MEQYLVKRPSDSIIVTIMKNKIDNTYSFINLTKEHICPCRFNSIEEAINGMNEKIKQGEVISYNKITPNNETIKDKDVDDIFDGQICIDDIIK